MKTSILREELERLKRISGLGFNLEVLWKPRAEHELSGEVKGNIIYVYDVDEMKAVETLYHEFLDHSVSQLIEPYKKVTNKLISMINEDAYRTKEETVQGLVKLLRAVRVEVCDSR